MLESLIEIIEKYSIDSKVDIEWIARKHWVNVDFVDFKYINWITLWDRIGINSNLPKDKQRYTIAHELCHYILKEKWISEGEFFSIEERESRADEFAMIILLPANPLIEVWKRNSNIDYLAELFCVPKDIVRNRLIGLIFNK